MLLLPPVPAILCPDQLQFAPDSARVTTRMALRYSLPQVAAKDRLEARSVLLVVLASPAAMLQSRVVSVLSLLGATLIFKLHLVLTCKTVATSVSMEARLLAVQPAVVMWISVVARALTALLEEKRC